MFRQIFILTDGNVHRGGNDDQHPILPGAQKIDVLVFKKSFHFPGVQMDTNRGDVCGDSSIRPHDVMVPFQIGISVGDETGGEVVGLPLFLAGQFIHLGALAGLRLHLPQSGTGGVFHG